MNNTPTYAELFQQCDIVYDTRLIARMIKPDYTELFRQYVIAHVTNLGFTEANSIDVYSETTINPHTFQVHIKAMRISTPCEKDNFIMNLYGKRKLLNELSVNISEL